MHIAGAGVAAAARVAAGAFLDFRRRRRPAMAATIAHSPRDWFHRLEPYLSS